MNRRMVIGWLLWATVGCIDTNPIPEAQHDDPTGLGSGSDPDRDDTEGQPAEDDSGSGSDQEALTADVYFVSDHRSPASILIVVDNLDAQYLSIYSPRTMQWSFKPVLGGQVVEVFSAQPGDSLIFQTAHATETYVLATSSDEDLEAYNALLETEIHWSADTSDAAQLQLSHHSALDDTRLVLVNLNTETIETYDIQTDGPHLLSINAHPADTLVIFATSPTTPIAPSQAAGLRLETVP